MKTIFQYVFYVWMMSPTLVLAQNFGCLTHVSNEIVSVEEMDGGMCSNIVELCLAKNQASMVEMDFQLNHMFGSMSKKYYVSSRPVGYQICHQFEFMSPCHTDISLTGYGRNTQGTFCGAWSTYFPLPVELIRFEGQRHNGKSCLEWEVANEVDIRRYIVERSSDGRLFVPVAQLSAKAEGLETYTYQYCDDGNLENVYLYRLGVQELNGDINYSNTIAIFSPENAPSTPRVWPIPSSHLIVVDNMDDEIHAFNSAGKQVELEPLGNSAYGITHLASGTYFIHDRRGQNVRFVKK